MAKGLEGEPRQVAESLVRALKADNGPLIHTRFNKLRSLLGKNLPKHAGDLRALLTDETAARLERVTTFKF